MDSTTIPWIASCLDWARHRRRKAAAKYHLRLDRPSFLPRFAIIDTAREADAEDDKNEPPQKLSLAFSTAEVVVLGWSLGRLADKLRENNFAVVRVQPRRFANLSVCGQNQPGICG